MNRITRKDSYPPYYLQHRKRGPVKMRNKAIFKLSAYEDTGLEPEEVWALKRQMRERDETNPSETAGLECVHQCRKKQQTCGGWDETTVRAGDTAVYPGAVEGEGAVSTACCHAVSVGGEEQTAGQG